MGENSQAVLTALVETLFIIGIWLKQNDLFRKKQRSRREDIGREI